MRRGQTVGFTRGKLADAFEPNHNARSGCTGSTLVGSFNLNLHHRIVMLGGLRPIPQVTAFASLPEGGWSKGDINNSN